MWRNGRIGWTGTERTTIETLAEFTPAQPGTDLPLRMPLQDVYKFDDRRILAGRVESGVLTVGDELVFSPSNRTARSPPSRAGTPRVTSPGPRPANRSASRWTNRSSSSVVKSSSHVGNAPIETDVFHLRLFWLADTPMEIGCALWPEARPPKVAGDDRTDRAGHRYRCPVRPRRRTGRTRRNRRCSPRTNPACCARPA